MKESISDVTSDLRVSPKPVAGALAALALVLTWTSDTLSRQPQHGAAQNVVVSCYVLAAVVWLLDRWRPWAGRWSAIVAPAALILLGSGSLGVPELLPLMSLPVALAAAMSGLTGAMVTALIETILLVLLPGQVAAGAGRLTVVVSLVSAWSTVAVMAGIYRPVYQRSEWLQYYFENARDLLGEARARKAELEQATTDLRNANRQLRTANERMVALRFIAEDAQKVKATFVAKVSHEFRTPLNMIIGLVELMAETPEIYAVELPPEMDKDLGVVLRNCRHLSGMIDDVLDLTRIDTGHVMLHKEWSDLVAIVDEAVAAVRPLVEKKGLEFCVSTPQDVPAVYCDRTRIRQVILNLVSNAARFTEEGGIGIDMAVQDQRVVVRVRDTGPGIAPEDVERIFEPFSQGTSNVWREKGGTGLGLSISRQFVRLHHGRLWLESEVGVGSCFAFELPIASPADHRARPGYRIREDWVWREDAFRASQAALADRPSRPRVIVCDETGGLVPGLERYLDHVDLVRVHSPLEVSRQMGAYPADAVMLNVAVPGDLCVRFDEARLEVPGTPVVGCAFPARAERAVASGATGHLVKPVSRGDLEGAIRRVGRPVRRVLAVDDDPDVLGLFARMLHVCDDGLVVETASSGEEALARVQAEAFDLVFLDVVLPAMDGWEVLARLRGCEGLADLPVFVVSAQDPADRPPSSALLLASVEGGLSVKKALRCSLELASLLLTPDAELDPAPPQNGVAEQAWRGTARRPAPAPGSPP